MTTNATTNDTAINKWLPDIICAFQAIGGAARLPQIYRWIQLNRRILPAEWKAVIRATIYHQSSDSPIYPQGNPDIFFKISYGLWALRYPSDKVIGKTNNDLFMQVLASMSVEQFESYSGKGDALIAYVKEEVDKLKKKYKVTS
jgi:hypothetical protein